MYYYYYRFIMHACFFCICFGELNLDTGNCKVGHMMLLYEPTVDCLFTDCPLLYTTIHFIMNVSLNNVILSCSP